MSNSTDSSLSDTSQPHLCEASNIYVDPTPKSVLSPGSNSIAAMPSLSKLVQQAFETITTSSPRSISHRKTRIKESKSKRSSGKTEMYGNLKKTIEEFNNNIGNETNRSEVKRAIESMRALGGVPCKGIAKEEMPPKIRINDARRGLMYILENLDKTADPKLRVRTLKALQDCLAYPAITENSSDGLLLLANQFREIMHPDLVQGRSTSLQIEILKTFSMFAELIIQTYFAKNNNAIDQRLKEQFIETIRDLKSFNTNGHNDPVLSFHAEMALEAIKRLKSNRQELLDLLKIIYHTGMSASELSLMIYGHGYASDVELISEHLQEALANIKIYIKNSWYDEWLFIHKELSKTAKNNLNDLELMQMRFVQHYEKSNWRFTYAVLELLSDIALNGATPEIRMRALLGNPQMTQMLPGLVTFSNCSHIATKIKTRPLMHFKRPKNVDYNQIIRIRCIKELNKIVNESQDPNVCMEAKKALLNRLSCEDNLNIKAAIQEIVPSDKSRREKWLKSKPALKIEDRHANLLLKAPKVHNKSHEKSKSRRSSISINSERYGQSSLSPSLSLESNCCKLNPRIPQTQGQPAEYVIFDMIRMTKDISTQSREEKDREEAPQHRNIYDIPPQGHYNAANVTTTTTTSAMKEYVDMLQAGLNTLSEASVESSKDSKH